MKNLKEYAEKQELILVEVFLHGDDEEQETTVYAEPVRNGFIYSVNNITGKTLVWRLKEDQDKIAKKYREEILTYRLARYTDEDEVSLGDIFMHGEHCEQVKIN